MAMRMENFLASAAVLAIVMGASMAMAGPDKEKEFNGITYACAGVGGESQTDPRWQRYPAKLVFAGGNGDYLSNIAVNIENAKGEPVFEAVCDGPWLLVDLPPDKYRIAAVAENSYRNEFTMTVGSGHQVEKIVRFPEVMR
jgi:hypothetical protein